MNPSPRKIRTRMAVGVLLFAAGLAHSLYYINGLLAGWEKDVWNQLQVLVGLAAAGAGIWTLRWRWKSFAGRGLLLLRTGQILMGLGILIFLILEGLIWQAGRKAESQPSDYLLILGARVRGETVSLTLRDRLEQGLAYLKQHPGTPVIVSGGQGDGENIPEAEAMKRYLTERGVPAGQILKEDRSRDTFQNVKLSRQMLENSGVDPEKVTITLVTSDFHMFRAHLLAERAGFHVLNLPASTPEFTLPKAYTREFAALIKSYWMDR